jgi:hypothetical protein
MVRTLRSVGPSELPGTIRHKNMYPRRPANLLDRCLLVVASTVLVVLAGCPGHGGNRAVAHPPDDAGNDAGLSCEHRVAPCDGGVECDWNTARASASSCFGSFGGAGFAHPYPARCGPYNALVSSGGDQGSIGFYDPTTGRLVGGISSHFTGKDSCVSFDSGFVLPIQPGRDCTPLVPQCPLCPVDGFDGSVFSSCSNGGDDAGTP